MYSQNFVFQFDDFNLRFQRTLLGGINLVDYEPWNGDFTGTVVHDNTIFGGFATDVSPTGTKGTNWAHAITK